MRSRLFSFGFIAFFALLIFAGCERREGLSFTAEIDEPSYRRGKELLRQGRNQEALNEFQKVIDSRGLNNAPESHLEVGLLYQHHIKDPLAAIYHYRKYRELKPNSPQSDLVRQQIDASTREFAKTLPAQPMDNQLERIDMNDVVQRLQRDNEQLKGELARARASLAELRSRTSAQVALPSGPTDTPSRLPALNSVPENSPLSSASMEPEPTPTPPAARPGTVRPGATTATAPAGPARNPAPPPAAAAGRKHTVAKGETLMSIAQRYYGNRSRYHDLYNANRDVLKSETDLRPGMELKVP